MLYATVILGAVIAGFIQGLSGFAFAMVAMSVWAWSLEPRLAAVLVVVGAVVGQLAAAVGMRRSFSPGRLWPFLLGGLTGIPLGTALLPALDIVLFKAGLGCLLVVWCPVMLMAHRLPVITFGGRLADGAIGLVGGTMGGLGGFCGVVPTLWCSLRGYRKDEQRDVIQNFNLAMQLVTLGTYAASGLITRDNLPLCALVGLSALIPSMLGNRLYFGISELAFRRVVLGILSLSGAAMLVSSVPLLLPGLFAR